jgi:hypothetical protein
MDSHGDGKGGRGKKTLMVVVGRTLLPVLSRIKAHRRENGSRHPMHPSPCLLENREQEA